MCETQTRTGGIERAHEQDGRIVCALGTIRQLKVVPRDCDALRLGAEF